MRIYLSMIAINFYHNYNSSMTEDITTDYYFIINGKFKGVMFQTNLQRILNSPLKQWDK